MVVCGWRSIKTAFLGETEFHSGFREPRCFPFKKKKLLREILNFVFCPWVPPDLHQFLIRPIYQRRMILVFFKFFMAPSQRWHPIKDGTQSKMAPGQRWHPLKNRSHWPDLVRHSHLLIQIFAGRRQFLILPLP